MTNLKRTRAWKLSSHQNPTMDEATVSLLKLLDGGEKNFFFSSGIFWDDGFPYFSVKSSTFLSFSNLSFEVSSSCRKMGLFCCCCLFVLFIKSSKILVTLGRASQRLFPPGGILFMYLFSCSCTFHHIKSFMDSGG